MRVSRVVSILLMRWLFPSVFAAALVFAVPSHAQKPKPRAGLLVRPFRQTVRLSGGYFIAWPEDRRRSPKIARFRDWLLAEAAADPDIAAEIALTPA